MAIDGNALLAARQRQLDAQYQAQVASPWGTNPGGGGGAYQQALMQQGLQNNEAYHQQTRDWRQAQYQKEISGQEFGQQQQSAEAASARQRQRDELLNGFDQEKDWRQHGYNTERDYFNDVRKAMMEERGHQAQAERDQLQQAHQAALQQQSHEFQAGQQSQSLAFQAAHALAQPDIQGQIHQIQLTQGEEMRRRRDREAIAHVEGDDSLDRDTRRAMITRIRTGLDPLEARFNQGRILTQQLQQQQTRQQTQQEATLFDQQQNFLTQRLQDRMITIPHPVTGRPQTFVLDHQNRPQLIEDPSQQHEADQKFRQGQLDQAERQRQDNMLMGAIDHAEQQLHRVLADPAHPDNARLRDDGDARQEYVNQLVARRMAALQTTRGQIGRGGPGARQMPMADGQMPAAAPPAAAPGALPPITRQHFPAGPGGDRAFVAAQAAAGATPPAPGQAPPPPALAERQPLEDVRGRLSDAYNAHGAYWRAPFHADVGRNPDAAVDVESPQGTNLAVPIGQMHDLVEQSQRADRPMTAAERNRYRDLWQIVHDVNPDMAANFHLPGMQPTYHSTHANVQQALAMVTQAHRDAGISDSLVPLNNIRKALARGNHFGRGLSPGERQRILASLGSLAPERHGRLINDVTRLLGD